MKCESTWCQVFLFDIDQDQPVSACATRQAFSRFGRQVRIVCADEAHARDRLRQMYPRWRVLGLQVQPFEPPRISLKPHAQAEVGLHS